MAKKKEDSFEACLTELEEIVNDMENKEPSLAELIEKYNRGMELSQKCLKELDNAEAAMDVMLKEENAEILELKLEIEGE